jgi:hypothetical protein
MVGISIGEIAPFYEGQKRLVPHCPISTLQVRPDALPHSTPASTLYRDDSLGDIGGRFDHLIHVAVIHLDPDNVQLLLHDGHPDIIEIASENLDDFSELVELCGWEREALIPADERGDPTENRPMKIDTFNCSMHRKLLYGNPKYPITPAYTC